MLAFYGLSYTLLISRIISYGFWMETYIYKYCQFQFRITFLTESICTSSMLLIGFVQLDKFASIFIEHNSILSQPALRKRLTAMHLFTALCATATVTLYVLSVKRLFAVQFSVNELDPVFLRTYLYFMNLYGLANGILYGILTVLLVAVTVLILRTMNNGSQY